MTFNVDNKPIYKIIFCTQNKICELYAHSIHQGALFGFIEVENLIFGDKAALVVDPSEETLKAEFDEVSCTYIPMHTIIRIDKVNKKGSAKITNVSKEDGNIMPFPVYTPPGDSKKT